ncbi:hypothetical protein [Shewanella sp. SM29]|uniref:hypothetical protein n=1 Tax=Shewanella sp. SM29 TaxID=2912795 RepID=UPI0021DA36C4|nr:hypothetical protein [Shewanella sp. SM29]MCU8073838.1 hypothetical protein [Shewanella sp. SM29]
MQLASRYQSAFIVTQLASMLQLIWSQPHQNLLRILGSSKKIVYFFKNLAAEKQMKILDFKELHELLFEGDERLKRGNEF